MKPSCHRLWEVDAVREGRLLGADAVASERHRSTCRACHARFVADEHLAELGRSLSVDELDELRVRRLRARVLRGAAEPERSKRPFFFAAAAIVCLLALGLSALFKLEQPSKKIAAAPQPAATAAPAEFAANVNAVAGADWMQTREHDVERVTLTRGRLSIEVRKQRPGERFLVDLADGEIEVRGTHFEVAVDAARTTEIRVINGIIVFRRPNQPEVVLGANESWTAPESAASVAPSARPRARQADSEATAAEYETAMGAYQARRFDEAAELFGRFVELHPKAREAEDASFLEANSLAHAGRTDAAVTVAEHFLKRYPSSFHARDAAVLAARAARDRGDCDRARALLAPWIESASAEMASALGNCSQK